MTKYTTTTSAPACSTNCGIAVGIVCGGIAVFLLLVVVLFFCRRNARAGRAANGQVVHITNGNQSSPPPPAPAPTNPTQPNPFQWTQPQPQPMYGAPLSPYNAPNNGVVPLGYTPPPYTQPTGGYGGYSGVAGGVAGGNYYYSRGADAEEADTRVKPFSE